VFIKPNAVHGLIGPPGAPSIVPSNEVLAAVIAS